MTPTPTNLPSITLPLSDIKYGDRLRSQDDIREDKEAYEELYKSIEETGQLVPILIDSDNNLIDGGRRYTILQDLEKSEVKVAYIEVLTPAQATIFEVEANKHRRFNWKHRCLAIDKIHTKYAIDAALVGKGWTNKATADLLGIKGSSNVWYALEVARLLKSNDPEIHKCETMNDAVKTLLSRAEALANKRLVELSLPKMTDKVLNLDLTGQKSTFDRPGGKPSSSQSQSKIDSDFPSLGELKGYVPGVGTGDSFFTDEDEAPGSGEVMVSAPLVIPISRMLYRETDHNNLAVFTSLGLEFCDHIISDPPYAIPMGNLQQSGTGMDVSNTAKEHNVEDNYTLLKRFIPFAYSALRPSGFCILWCDYSLFSTLSDWAEQTGFKVQPWPLIWSKTSPCLNQASQYNFTKNHECAIVLRKGNATLLSPQTSSVWTGSNDVEAKSLGHPFAKPFALWKWLYSATAIKGAVVCDPFAGRGSSTLAGIQYGIKPIAIECNEEHFNHLVLNVQNQYKSLSPNVEFC